MSNYIHFRDVIPERPETWQGKRVLSFDIDWAEDFVIDYTINLIESARVKACFFITHDTPLLSRLRSNTNFELGIHPNFEPLICGKSSSSAKEIIESLVEIVPGANILRSHCMTTSGRWLDVYKYAGITHLSNYLMFGDRNIHPFRQLNGLIESPVYYADDGLLYQMSKNSVTFDLDYGFTNSNAGLQVYNFHPIHIYLNTKNLDHYKSSIKYADNKIILNNMRYHGNGASTWLTTLLNVGRK